MKKYISMVMVLILLGSLPVYGLDIQDIDGHWGQPFIDTLVSEGVVSGYPDGSFKPDAVISRAEFTVMLLKAQSIEPLDQTDSHWASGWRAAALAEGILLEGSFNDLDKNITRGEIALMITRSIGASPYSMARKTDIVDADGLDQSLKMAIYSVYDYGIVSGYADKTFKQDQQATRAEAATMTVRTIDPEKRSDNPRTFNKDSLAYFDGTAGKAVLVAVSGQVYDFSNLDKWSGGTHMNTIRAGQDLTKEIMEDSPHGLYVLSRAEIVGTYVEE